jgi:hypothetical protein
LGQPSCLPVLHGGLIPGLLLLLLLLPAQRPTLALLLLPGQVSTLAQLLLLLLDPPPVCEYPECLLFIFSKALQERPRRQVLIIGCCCCCCRCCWQHFHRATKRLSGRQWRNWCLLQSTSRRHHLTVAAVASTIAAPHVLLPTGTLKHTPCWHCLDAVLRLLLLLLLLLVLCCPSSNPQRQCASHMPGKGIA